MKAGHHYAAAPAASPAIAVPVSLVACYAAWLKAGRTGRWQPARTVSFILDNPLEPNPLQLPLVRGRERLAPPLIRGGREGFEPNEQLGLIVSHPKTREIHAPDFADRVVHHLLVERLEKLYEPVFIHDSYANRKGRGGHAAVDRLQQFMRSRNGQGCYLQLDIHNYFNSINRPILYQMLCHRLHQCEQRAGLPAAHALALRSLCHKLLANKVSTTMRDPAAAARVPPHKRLANAAPGCGLPVGNLTSQFFANVYLNALDQFVKHTLKCRHYVRYVDDFVLLADDAAQLRVWQTKINEFLAATLGLKCKDAVLLQPLCQGIDFLGYRVFAGHRRVRPRVVAHCRAKLQDWAARHVPLRRSGFIPTQSLSCRDESRSTENDALTQLQAMLGSYWGHFAHANSVRLRHALFNQFVWLKSLFTLHPDGHLTPRWVLQGATFVAQAAALQAEWPQAQCLIQKGNRWVQLSQPGQELNAPASQRLTASLRRQGIAYVCANQTGWLRHGTRRREVQTWFDPNVEFA